MTETTKPHALLDEGTRFRHLSDLLDLWTDAVEITRSSFNKFPNDKDRIRLATCEASVRMLRAYMDALGNWDEKQWGLRDVIERIPRIPRETSKIIDLEIEEMRAAEKSEETRRNERERRNADKRWHGCESSESAEGGFEST